MASANPLGDASRSMSTNVFGQKRPGRRQVAKTFEIAEDPDIVEVAEIEQRTIQDSQIFQAAMQTTSKPSSPSWKDSRRQTIYGISKTGPPANTTRSKFDTVTVSPRKSPRLSLTKSRERIPLQEGRGAIQVPNYLVDRPGPNTGKENIAPGMTVNGTAKSKAISARTSRVPPQGTTGSLAPRRNLATNSSLGSRPHSSASLGDRKQSTAKVETVHRPDVTNTQQTIKITSSTSSDRKTKARTVAKRKYAETRITTSRHLESFSLNLNECQALPRIWTTLLAKEHGIALTRFSNPFLQSSVPPSLIMKRQLSYTTQSSTAAEMAIAKSRHQQLDRTGCIEMVSKLFSDSRAFNEICVLAILAILASRLHSARKVEQQKRSAVMELAENSIHVVDNRVWVNSGQKTIQAGLGEAPRSQQDDAL